MPTVRAMRSAAGPGVDDAAGERRRASGQTGGPGNGQQIRQHAGQQAGQRFRLFRGQGPAGAGGGQYGFYDVTHTASLDVRGLLYENERQIVNAQL